ncbi:hypothetical protein V6N13_018934 [Hibiscus sabdariffa]|uniref:Uncharacterized protein n=1 Tax=Hibiscus sabdariffa TaxID=183260 RepID=A0ABR2EM42_9ROSI
MPPHIANSNKSALGGDAPPTVVVQNISESIVELLMQAMIRALKLTLFLPIVDYLSSFCKLCGKDFSGIKKGNSTKNEYGLERIERILKQLSCSVNDRLGYIVFLLDGEAHR